MRKKLAAIVAGILCLALEANAQWNPPAGQWGKTDARDVRIMTWNVLDGICSSNDKIEALANWCALARIVAAMKPDVLLLQETGDNSGNGTGSGVDSVNTLTTTIDLFLHGGNDPFNGGTPITAWVQKYDAGYDLPYVFVSSSTDGFNRNVILSRFPFTDLNGDGRSQQSDIPFISADLYAPGGTGGIRGFQIAEIDLPDTDYPGELVIGNAHLKSGGDASSQSQRITASQNVAYYIDYLLNGAGSGSPDPRNRIGDTPAASIILDGNTSFIAGGDWNEDELTNGRMGPAEWLTSAQTVGGTDGTDRDRTDAMYDDARDAFNHSRTTLSSAKFDYLAWQDSIASIRHAVIFNSMTVTPASAMPAEIIGFPGGAVLASGFAADHRPVIADFIVALGPTTPPVLTTINPPTGPLRGGNDVDLFGSNFSAVATVTFDGLTASVLSRSGSTAIRVRVPAGSAVGQTADVTVSQAGGTSTLVDAYTYGDNPVELVMTGTPRVGSNVTFTLYGPSNRRVGFALGRPGSLMRAGFTFCFMGPFDIRRTPMQLNTGALGRVSVQWSVNGSGMRNAQGLVHTAGGYVQTNCVSFSIQP